MKIIIFFTFIIYFCEGTKSFNKVENFNETENLVKFISLRNSEVLAPPTVTIINDLSKNQNMSGIINVRLPFIGEPCSCAMLNCGCCAGMQIQQFNFDQKSNNH